MLTSLNIPGKKKLQNTKLVVTFLLDSMLVIRQTGSGAVKGRELALSSFAPSREGEGVAVEPATDAAKATESTEASTKATGEYLSRVKDSYSVDPSFIRVYTKEDVDAQSEMATNRECLF